jgi:hypothetical protein
MPWTIINADRIIYLKVEYQLCQLNVYLIILNVIMVRHLA